MATPKKVTKSVMLTPSLIKRIERWSVPVEAHAGKLGESLSFSDKVSMLIELGLGRNVLTGAAKEMYEMLVTDTDPEEAHLAEWGRVLSPSSKR